MGCLIIIKAAPEPTERLKPFMLLLSYERKFGKKEGRSPVVNSLPPGSDKTNASTRLCNKLDGLNGRKEFWYDQTFEYACASRCYLRPTIVGEKQRGVG